MTLDAALRAWVPQGISLGFADPRQHYPLFEQEKPAVANAIEKRQMEFSAGRHAARCALQDHGLAACDIPVGHRRAPVWPEGISGSITHSNHICLAIAARHTEFVALGLDAEPDVPLKDTLRRAILHESERDVSASQAIALFSMKEALFKMLFPLTQEWMGFHAAKQDGQGGLELTQTFGNFKAGTRFDVPVLRTEGHVISLCALPFGGA